MAETLIKLAAEQNLMASDDELRNSRCRTVGILYGYENYHRDCKHIMEIMAEIRKDYPKMEAKDMDVWQLGPEFSAAHRTCVRVNIPVEDFIILRKLQQLQKL